MTTLTIGCMESLTTDILPTLHCKMTVEMVGATLATDRADMGVKLDLTKHVSRFVKSVSHGHHSPIPHLPGVHTSNSQLDPAGENCQ